MGGDPAPRGDFAVLTDADLAAFREILGDDNVRTDARSLDACNEDWMRKYRGNAGVLLLPARTSQVSAILRHCNARGLAVVPQGGNTGLVGGGVPVHDEIVLGLRRMNAVLSVDPVAGTVVCEAGCVLEDLEHALNARGMTAPLDLGAKGRCQIGGNVSTNAGGLRLVRHGSLHGSVLGLEVVTADGTVLDLLRTLRKDNTGYDLKQLFIGAEGTLGVVTKVAMLSPRKPTGVDVAVCAVGSFADAVAALRDARTKLGDCLQAFEFFDRASLDLVLSTLRGARDPLPKTKAPFYVVTETAVFGDGSGKGSATHRAARRRVRAWVRSLRKRGVAIDGVVGEDAKHASALWNLRERISVALKHAGAVYKYDVSLSTERMYDLVVETRNRLAAAASASASASTSASTSFDASKVSVLGYGHLGDGNLHLNVSSPDGYHPGLEAILEPFVYQWTAEQRGSISAEHGVGAMKPRELAHSKDEASIEAMRRIKEVFDPRGILNPYKVLPLPRLTEHRSKL
jgi:D-2-hydroxyglutarate dehydrogenase